MFPYRDDNPNLRTPFMTYALIGVTVLVWFVVQGAGSQPALGASVCRLGAIPGELLGRIAEPTVVPIAPQMGCRVGDDAGNWYTLVTSMFLHGSWFHIIGNMWFLWVFGDNVEDSMGHARFTLFYLMTGVLAAGAQIVSQPGSPVPMVGASGAISGVMGGYLVLYPRARVHMLVFLGFFVTTVVVPSYLMLLYWAFLQFLGSLPMLAGAGEGGGGGVAFMAHLGGFVAGVALIKLFAKRELVLAHRRATVTQAARARLPWE
jgi:membrane associated rhomboid family serine protease